MRTIKFRAWDKERKEMREVQLMDWSDWWVSTGSTWERGNQLEYGERNSFKNEDTDRHILMQYTGLKDRQGKEIFEGDIIKYKEMIPSENKIQKIIQGADFVYLEFVGQVVWDGEGASFDVDGGDHGYRGFGARGSKEYEVIGNIYANPELLEVTP